jgi:hypothetical protein
MQYVDNCLHHADWMVSMCCGCEPYLSKIEQGAHALDGCGGILVARPLPSWPAQVVQRCISALGDARDTAGCMCKYAIMIAASDCVKQVFQRAIHVLEVDSARTHAHKTL